MITNEEFWNNKHPKEKVVYNGRSLALVCAHCKQGRINQQIPVDVRDMLTPESHILKDLIVQENLKGQTEEETIWNIQKFVVKNITYISDDKSQGVPEFWQYPVETLVLRRGDCEDGSILIASLAIAAGIPSHKIRVVGGMVKPHEITAPEGGHGYVVYLRESEQDGERGNWVVIDWCFYQDSHLEIKNKPIVKNNQVYKEVFFSFNDKYSWASHQFEIQTRMTSYKS